MGHRLKWPLGSLCAVLLTVPCVLAAERPKAQYRHGDIDIPIPKADEPRRAQISVRLADDYLQQGARAWAASRNCVSCHTTGLYLQVRPALTPQLGPPDPKSREFFIEKLGEIKASDRESLLQGTKPAEVIYLAAGLAEWDAHVALKLSSETVGAIDQMFELQLSSGTWGSLDCWPPFESDAYHLATVAAMAIGTAPGWLPEGKRSRHVQRLAAYLRQTAPPHDYGRTLLLWASTRFPGLLSTADQKTVIDLVASRQRPDGGWSIRSFADPEQWGSGNRAAKLRAEPEFGSPPSDGHMTGLAIVVLRQAGVPQNDARLQRGLAWLKVNQRASGRWWTRSLNTDTYHYITYSATAFPLLALGLCGELRASDAP